MKTILILFIMMVHLIHKNAQSDDITSLINNTIEVHLDYFNSLRNKPCYVDINDFPHDSTLTTFLSEREIFLIDAKRRENFMEEKYVLHFTYESNLQQDSIVVNVRGWQYKTTGRKIYAGRTEDYTSTLWILDSDNGEYKLTNVTHK